MTAWQNQPGSNPSSQTSDLYDGEGQRVEQQVTSGGTTSTVTYVGTVEEVATSGGTTTTTVYYYAAGGGAALIDALFRELREFTGIGWEQEDDVTLVAVHRAAGEGDQPAIAERPPAHRG